MRISVSGTRTSTADWQAVQALPEVNVPPLTPEERSVAEQLGIPLIDYARSALTAERGQKKLLSKVEIFARVLQEKVRERKATAEIEEVRLETLKERFYVDLQVDGRLLSIEIDENLVNDLLQRGDPEAERRLERVVGLTLNGKAA